MTVRKRHSTCRPNTSLLSMEQIHNTQPGMRHPSSPPSSAPPSKRSLDHHYNTQEQLILHYVCPSMTSQPSKPQQQKKTQTSTGQLLDYLETHPDATIRLYASGMILHIHSDASYLSVYKSRSRLGGLFYLGYNQPNGDKLNGSILNVANELHLG
jgi:hypothetical protein